MQKTKKITLLVIFSVFITIILSCFSNLIASNALEEASLKAYYSDENGEKTEKDYKIDDSIYSTVELTLPETQIRYSRISIIDKKIDGIQMILKNVIDENGNDITNQFGYESEKYNNVDCSGVYITSSLLDKKDFYGKTYKFIFEEYVSDSEKMKENIDVNGIYMLKHEYKAALYENNDYCFIYSNKIETNIQITDGVQHSVISLDEIANGDTFKPGETITYTTTITEDAKNQSATELQLEYSGLGIYDKNSVKIVDKNKKDISFVVSQKTKNDLNIRLKEDLIYDNPFILTFDVKVPLDIKSNKDFKGYICNNLNIVGYGKTSDDKDLQIKIDTSENIDIPDTPDVPDVPDVPDTSNDYKLKINQFYANNQIITLPCNVSELKKINIEIDDKLKEKTLKAREQLKDINISDNITIDIYNDSDKSLNILDCKIIKIDIKNSTNTKDYVFVGNTTFDRTTNDYKSILDNYPHLKMSGENGIAYTGFSDKDDNYTIGYTEKGYGEKSILSNITISVNNLIDDNNKDDDKKDDNKKDDNDKPVAFNISLKADKETYKFGETGTYKFHFDYDKTIENINNSTLSVKFDKTIDENNYDIKSIILNDKTLDSKNYSIVKSTTGFVLTFNDIVINNNVNLDIVYTIKLINDNLSENNLITTANLKLINDSYSTTSTISIEKKNDEIKKPDKPITDDKKDDNIIDKPTTNDKNNNNQIFIEKSNYIIKVNTDKESYKNNENVKYIVLIENNNEKNPENFKVKISHINNYKDLKILLNNNELKDDKYVISDENGYIVLSLKDTILNKSDKLEIQYSEKIKDISTDTYKTTVELLSDNLSAQTFVKTINIEKIKEENTNIKNNSTNINNNNKQSNTNVNKTQTGDNNFLSIIGFCGIFIIGIIFIIYSFKKKKH